ncbi:MAG: YolD-like family protein [Clostridia bacterium]|nr:YolD-like family protein [Clostridia bacterium]
MDRIDRAKQFLPFDAMKGLKEALERKEKEKMRTEKRELSEEDAEELSRRLSKLERGSEVSVLCHKNGYYLEKRGKIEEFNVIYKYMKIGGEKIFFDDIYRLDSVE